MPIILTPPVRWEPPGLTKGGFLGSQQIQLSTQFLKSSFILLQFCLWRGIISDLCGSQSLGTSLCLGARGGEGGGGVISDLCRSQSLGTSVYLGGRGEGGGGGVVSDLCRSQSLGSSLNLGGRGGGGGGGVISDQCRSQSLRTSLCLRMLFFSSIS